MVGCLSAIPWRMWEDYSRACSRVDSQHFDTNRRRNEVGINVTMVKPATFSDRRELLGC